MHGEGNGTKLPKHMHSLLCARLHLGQAMGHCTEVVVAYKQSIVFKTGFSTWASEGPMSCTISLDFFSAVTAGLMSSCVQFAGIDIAHGTVVIWSCLDQWA